jgi:phosphate transport system protein
VTAELRSEHHRHLERLDIALGALLGVIPDAVEQATESVLTGDVALRADLDRWQAMVVSISEDVDHTSEVIIARQAPMAGELRFLMSCVRLVLNLSDTIDLVSEVGGSAALAWNTSMSNRVRPMIAAIGREAAGAWRTVSEMWDGKPEANLHGLRAQDDRLAETRTALTAELVAGRLDPALVGQLAGVTHGYERITRHAVSAGRLIEDLTHPGSYRPGEGQGVPVQSPHGSGDLGPDEISSGGQ